MPRLSAESGQQYQDSFPVKAPLSAVKDILLASTGWASPAVAGQYVVKTSPRGDPLDESKSLEDHGVTDGAMLYLAKA